MAIDGISSALANPALNLPRVGQATAAAAADVVLNARQQGIVDRTALQTALTSTVVPTARTASDPTLAQALDRNGDGKVTPEELIAQTQSLADTLFGNLRQTPGNTVAASGPTATFKPQDVLSTSSQARPEAPATESGAVQLGNPSRVMALMNLMDLVSAYGPNGKPNEPTLPGGKTLDVSA